MDCTDPLLTALKAQGYNVVRLPRADIKPLQVLARTRTNLDALGPLSDVLGGDGLPAIRLDEPSAPVSGNKSRTNAVNAKVGVGFLGSIIQALGGKTAGLDAKYERAGTVTFEFLEVTRDSVDITKLDPFLGRGKLDPNSAFARKLLEGDGLYILTATLKSRKIKVDTTDTSNSSVGVDVPAIQGIVGANLEVTSKAQDGSSIVFDGKDQPPLVFAFQAVRVRWRDGKYETLELVDAGSVAMRGLDDAPSVMLGESAAAGDGNLVVFDTRRSPFVHFGSADEEAREVPAAGPAPARGRRALLIGIDRYANLPAPFNRLNGCVNDAKAMGLTLRDQFGFAPADIETLLDDQARRDDILAGFDRLVDRTAPGDLVVVHYSGHGSQVPDLEGDETDGLDETIVPNDSGRVNKPNRDITDDEIYERLRKLSAKTDAITLIFDCCHSGTITRDAFGELSRWVEPDLRKPGESGRPEMSVSAEAIAELKRASGVEGGSRDVGPTGFLPLDASYVLIAGCTDEERSFEYRVNDAGGDVRHGALTYFLLQEIAKATPGTTYRDVYEQASARVTATYSNQHPQIEGAADRELFGTRVFEPMRHVLVTAAKPGQLALAAGAAQGVTVGSTYSIYEPGLKEVTPAAKSLGLVKVSAVSGLGSVAVAVDVPDWAAIAKNCRAVEEEHARPPLEQVVEVVDRTGGKADVAGIVGKLAASKILRPAANSPDTPTIRAYALPAGKAEARGGAVPTLGEIGVPCWATVGLDGQLLTETFPIADAGSPGRLVENLETIARYRNVLEIRNTDANNPLAGKVDLILLRMGRDQAWEEAAAGEDGRVVFVEGDRVGLRLINKTGKPVYATVLDFGLTHAISPLFPPGDAKPQLALPSYDYATTDGNEIAFALPASFRRAEGVETIKLFVTTQPADFASLRQQGTRGADLGKGTTTALERLLAMANDGTRDASVTKVATIENWMTVERSFILKRRDASTL